MVHQDAVRPTMYEASDNRAALENKLTYAQLLMLQEQDRAAQAERERAAAITARDAAHAAKEAYAEQMAQAHAQMQAETKQQLTSLQALQRAVGALTDSEHASQEANAKLVRRVRVLDGERVDLELKLQVLQKQLELEQCALAKERAAARSQQGELADAFQLLETERRKRAAAEQQVAAMDSELAQLRKLVYGVGGGGHPQQRPKARRDAREKREHPTVTQVLAVAAPRCHRCKRLDRCS